MKIVKLKKSFIVEYKKHTSNDQLLESDAGRPCVLLVSLKYKGLKHNFLVPLRSNITSSAPKSHYFALPNTSKTKPGNHAGIHYIKIFPVSKVYIDRFRIDAGSEYELVQKIIDKNEQVIIKACQNYLNEYESEKRSPLTPDIDSILIWL